MTVVSRTTREIESECDGGRQDKEKEKEKMHQVF
jgi:hypothetical protein